MSKSTVQSLCWILFCGLALAPRETVGQTTDQDRVENSSRDAVRAQLDAHRANVAASADVFFDQSLSDDEREKAVQNITAFLDEENVQRAIRAAGDAEESVRIKVLALARIQPYLDREIEFVDDLFNWLGDPSTPREFRRSVADTLNGIMFSSFTMHAKHAEYLTLLRGLLRDPDEELRRLAFSTLIVNGDDEAEQLLLRGLQSQGEALLSPVDSIRILGLNLHGDAFPVLDQVLMNPPDEDSRLEALRLLGSYLPSRDKILEVLNKSEESDTFRLAALQTLNANVPDQFASYTLRIVADERVADTLRTYAIQSEFQRRLARRHEIKTLEQATDSFDAEIVKLRESDSDSVRRLATEYISALLPREQ